MAVGLAPGWPVACTSLSRVLPRIIAGWHNFDQLLKSEAPDSMHMTGYAHMAAVPIPPCPEQPQQSSGHRQQHLPLPLLAGQAPLVPQVAWRHLLQAVPLQRPVQRLRSEAPLQPMARRQPWPQQTTLLLEWAHAAEEAVPLRGVQLRQVGGAPPAQPQPPAQTNPRCWLQAMAALQPTAAALCLVLQAAEGLGLQLLSPLGPLTSRLQPAPAQPCLQCLAVAGAPEAWL